MSLLELKEVTVSFAFPDGRPALLALNQVNLSVAQGELVALVGPSGCGKTTALNVLAGQVVPTSGQVRLAGEPVQGILPSVGYISQADTLLPWRTVLDNVALAMELRGVPKSQRQETARALMKNMGLEGFEQSYPRELSGGMKKRAAIARVLAVDPAILMMDEPFWTPSPGSACRTIFSPSGRIRAVPSCMSPTTSPRPSPWQTGWSS